MDSGTPAPPLKGNEPVFRKKASPAAKTSPGGQGNNQA
jgi:hypothetical protein